LISCFFCSQDQQARLALPPIEQQAIAENPNELQTWTYVNKNSLMYPPEGVTESAVDVFKKPKQPREILLKNTRFQANPFNVQKSHSNLQEAANARCLAQQGKIGVDGKEVLPAQSPSVKGYGFVGTPSPAPGVDESPFMTWGEIEGTPFRLDGSDTPLINRTPGPSFKIPDMPYRDKLGLELADKAGASHRATKEKALNSAKANLTR
jgi:protein DGCR14